MIADARSHLQKKRTQVNIKDMNIVFFPYFRKNNFMKKSLSVFMICAVLVFTANSGCVKPSNNPTNPVSALPNLANFILQGASTFVAGAASVISISSSSLGAGTFTVNYNLSGANTANGLTASMTMSGTTGTFQTPPLANAGNTNITINSISNSGGSAPVTSNNTFAFTDSTGLLTCTVGSHAYRAMDVHATLAGSMLTIHSVYWDPLATVTLYVDYWAHITGSTYFNSNDLSFAGNPTSTFNGSAVYNGTSILQSQHGVITITSTGPTLITGTFSFTAQDSSIISSGNFSCPAP